MPNENATFDAELPKPPFETVTTEVELEVGEEVVVVYL